MENFKIRRFSEIRKEIDKKQNSVGVDIEGFRYNWFYVCADCRCVLDWKQETCPECKRRINWDE